MPSKSRHGTHLLLAHRHRHKANSQLLASLETATPLSRVHDSTTRLREQMICSINYHYIAPVLYVTCVLTDMLLQMLLQMLCYPRCGEYLGEIQHHLEIFRGCPLFTSYCPSPPTPFPSYSLPLLLPSPPTPFLSYYLPLLLPSPPTSFPSYSLPSYSLPLLLLPLLSSHLISFPSYSLPLLLPSPPTPFPSYYLVTEGERRSLKGDEVTEGERRSLRGRGGH